jgi:hypothetical protein
MAHGLDNYGVDQAIATRKGEPRRDRSQLFRRGKVCNEPGTQAQTAFYEKPENAGRRNRREIQQPARIVKMSDKDLQAELERLRAENEALKQGGRPGSVKLKVSEKGAVSVYGLGRFPVTLYQEQWLKLLAMADEIKHFIEENRGRLKVKE